MKSFTIITVVYNGKELFQGTMNSVFLQTYPNIEYIVIDGASSDGTIDLIKEQAEIFNKHNKKFNWISEKDKGLYDAMNKGLSIATGDFICFLNAGDWLFSENTIENLAKQIDENTDIIYGETMLVNEKREEINTMSNLSTRKLPSKLTTNSMRFGMVVVHQSFYVKRTISPLYDLNWKRCADIDWVINCLKKSKKTVNANSILTKYLMGGMSKQQHQASLKERFFILKKHFGILPTLFAHGFILLRAVFNKISNVGKPKY